MPTISMGLLAIVMPPVEAAAIVILPSFITNVWQMLVGPSLRDVFRRLWPMILASCIATWMGMGLMTGATARYGTAFLGIALALYALTDFADARVRIPTKREALLGPVAGAATGIVTAGTGVFVIPAVPYLQAIGLEKEYLVQALGLSFTASTLALAVNVAAEGGLNVSLAATTTAALALACLGMWIGQIIRRRLSPAPFRRCFFLSLLLLGVYLAARSIF